MGLRRLEYRGYDSAGIAVAGGANGLQIRRAEGKLRNLEEVIRHNHIDGTYGIGHTRWATHGRPSEENAHPHRDCTGTIVVVHNGIVENYLALKKQLREEGHTYKTETDTEVIAHLIEKYFILENPDKKISLEEAVRMTVKRLTGVFALSVICSTEPNKIIAARNGPPAVIGLGKDEYFVASDVPAILYHTRDLFFLGDGDLAVLTPEGVTLTDFDGKPVRREVQHITWDPIMAEKGGFKHFMLKEIYEQPRAVRDTAMGRVSFDTGKVFLEQMDVSEEEFRNLRKLNIAACGTSWHAGLAGKYMIERLARVPVEVDYASEFRYRNPLIEKNEMTLLITQSGETADTIAAQRECKSRGRQDAGHLQRGGRHDRARSRRHHLHPRRAGDRRGLDQGIHRAADRAVSLRAAPGAGARHHQRRRVDQADAGAFAAARSAGSGALAAKRRSRSWRAPISACRTSSSWDAAFTSRSRWRAR